MSIAYVREHYNMPWIKRGVKVIIGTAYGTPREGRIVSVPGAHIKVRELASGQVGNWHPQDVIQAPE